MKIRTLIVLLTALTMATSAAAAGGPQQKRTAHGMALAASTLVNVNDLGAGWTATATESNANSPVCNAVLAPRQSDLVQTGEAVSRIFTGAAGSEALGQSVRVFATPAEAGDAWTRTVTKKLVICMEQELEDSSTMSAPVSVTGWSPLALPHTVERLAGYNVTASAEALKNKTVEVRSDLLVLRQAMAVTTVSIISVDKPITASFVRRLTRALAQKLGSPRRTSTTRA